MNGCDKVKIKCEKGCGEVLQKCDTLDHQKKCPFRNQMCEYCRKEVQANRTNEHARICLDNPDGVVTCPYMEVGCETIEIARKDLNTHITQNMISHQKLLLHELNQLRIGNEQLRTENKQLNDKMNKKEFETTNKQTDLYRSIWILLALVITGIAILIPLILMERDKIQRNELSIQSHEQSIQSSIQSIQTYEQSIQSLMSTAGYITEFISDRGKTLQGIEWTHGYREDETVYGPIFYLGQCKLRMHVVTRQDSWHPSTEYGAKYYVRRLKGDNDDVINSCTITYIHFYNVNLADNSKFNMFSEDKDKQLEVGDEDWISREYHLWNKLDKLATVRIFFEFA
ncbi:TNF receptor-associated factor 6-like [Oopsacas minuta]|uniref:TNF receptor-associated factor 6-like n=1 Tax=Oopsacas minuta TaxID=111878 RepID=A0AAV7K806_9METZ|nr:TNF receptor-associated factor 6-like [Oopsacas minuta]